MLSTLSDLLVLVLMLVAALVMEAAIQILVSLRWFKNLALSFLE
jgi:hypothetical protein